VVVFDAPKDAVPVGTVAGAQLAAELKIPDPGLRSQVASCARAIPGSSAAATPNAVVASTAAMRHSRVRFEGR
jgi:hypothetical protein